MRKSFFTTLSAKATLLFLSVISLIPARVGAIEIINSTLEAQIKGKTGLGDKDPVQVTASLVEGFLTILGIIAIVLIIYGGFKWMTARGNEETVGEAKSLLGASFIGLAIILSSYGIALYVFSLIESSTGQTAL